METVSLLKQYFTFKVFFTIKIFINHTNFQK